MSGHRAARRAGGWVELVAAIVRATPKLTGALCVDDPKMFDGDTADDREAAAAICSACPARDACRAWRIATNRVRGTRPVGVLAGHHRRSGRSTDDDG